MKPLRPLLLLLTVIVATLTPGCSRKESAHSHGGHAHTAPHGGMLVELGDHAYNLELVRDAATGTLTAYVLDGHAENFIRITAQSFDATATVGAEKRPVTFKAVANTATGETAGDTSQFDTQADWLKTTAAFDLAIPRLEIRGTRFENVTCKFATGGEKR
jgi:hypothetical protein